MAARLPILRDASASLRLLRMKNFCPFILEEPPKARVTKDGGAVSFVTRSLSRTLLEDEEIQ
jgi:hypothetical protein